MKKEQIVRAWRDPELRARLSEEERAQLPAHPAGLLELSDEDLALLSGAAADEASDDISPFPISTSTRSTAVYSSGCSCICCV